MITLRRMSLRDCWAVINWRNAARAHLRTPTDDTRWTQFLFWLRVILNPFSPHRYRSVYQDEQLVGMVGICYRNRKRAEISLITDPTRRGQGLGKAAVRLTLAEAFGTLGLKQVYGEVFANNPAVGFWQRLAPNHWLPVQTRRGGELVDAYWFEWRRP